jgi:DNA polymerase-3 subunit alpha
MQSTDGVVKYISECRSHDIPIHPPDINDGNLAFDVAGSGIRFGLAAIKNVGESAIESIIEARGPGPFESIFDFCERVDLRKVNKRVLESLIKAGAFDSIGTRRSQLFTALEEILDYGQRVQREKSDPQMGLFGAGDMKPDINQPALAEIEEWNERQLLAFEKEALGFYITGHPLNRYRDIIEKYANADSIAMREFADGEPVRLAGIIRHTKVIKTRRGDLMAFATVEDMQGAFETTIFSSLYAATSHLLAEDTPVMLEGQLQKDENTVKILADKIVPIDQSEEAWTVSIYLNLEITETDRAKLLQLADILKEHPGSCEAFIRIRNTEDVQAVISLPETLKLNPSHALKREVNTCLGYRAFQNVCSKAGSALRMKKTQ